MRELSEGELELVSSGEDEIVVNDTPRQFISIEVLTSPEQGTPGQAPPLSAAL